MYRITIVDDDRKYAENVANCLSVDGYDVTVEDQTADAVNRLKADPPDLVILDVMFPEDPAGGLNVARQIRQTPGIRDIPIIMLTGVNQALPADFSENDIDDKWMPIQGFFEKPPDLNRLRARIRELAATAGSCP